jgi:UDP-3-O-[3-hydroxymyristoyl] glucosamine N-acyltransferase
MTTPLPTSIRTAEGVARAVGGDLAGPGDLPILGLELVDRAAAGHLTFVGSDRFAERWRTSAASAVLVNRSIQLPERPADNGGGRVAVIRVDDADAAMLTLLTLIESEERRATAAAAGIHPSAIVDPSAEIDPTAEIGPLCTIGARCRIAAEVRLHPGVHLAPEVSIGAGSVLHAGVCVRERCVIGARVVVHCNAAIGTDGFGYRPTSEGLAKVPHIGHVVLEDDVEIGANTCIDRGKFGATIVGRGTKIDNLCQIAHNCRIGRHCALSGLVGLAGTVTIGDGTRIGGGTGVADHITIGRGCTIAAKSGVMNDIPDGETWAGYPAQERTAAMRERVAVRKLPDLIKRLGQPAGGS